MPRPTSLNIVLNGVPKSVPVADGSEPLLLVLRNKLDQIGPKIGCGAEQCGVCTVLVNGAAVRACCAEVKSIPGGADVRTLDGLAERGHGHRKPKRLHGSDDDPAHIELPPTQAMAGRRREGMVVVVPTFAEGKDAAEGVVARMIVGDKLAAAKDVANRVD